MDYLRELGACLPSPLKLADLLPYAPESLWRADSEFALTSSLASSGKFDTADYLRRYPDVGECFIDPIIHFVRHGRNEGRTFTLQGNMAIQTAESLPEAIVENEQPEEAQYAAIIPLDHIPSRITSQYRTLRRQTLKPASIIYVIDESRVDRQLLKSLTGPSAQIIAGGAHYWRRALALAAGSSYAAILAPDAMPGEFWMASALRACRSYNAVAVAHGCLETGVSVQPAPVSETDAYCDWGHGIIFLPGRPATALVPLAGSDFDVSEARRLLTELYIQTGVSCISPMQPAWDGRFRVAGPPPRSLGSMDNANPDYTPVCRRRDQARIHLVVIFGRREWLERCLLSIKAQVYDNYTVTLVDDCCDGQSAQDLLERLALDRNKFRCICHKKRQYGMAGQKEGADSLLAAPADIVAHLDGDDWLNHPRVLQQLSRIYSNPAVLSTYGNMVRLTGSGNGISNYSQFDMSQKWNFAGNNPYGPHIPFRRLNRHERKNGMGCAPWGPLHLRSFRFGRYELLNGLHFRYPNGIFIRYCADAAIFIPIMDEAGYDATPFMPDPGYTYQQWHATSRQRGFSMKAWLTEDRRSVVSATAFQDIQRLAFSLFSAPVRQMPACASKTPAHMRTAVATIATPNYIGDGVLAIASYLRNLEADCAGCIYVCTRDEEAMDCLKAMCPDHIKLLFPTTLRHMAKEASTLEAKYGLTTDAYRWSMKGVLLQELLASGYEMALFLDPDTYTVADITDMHLKAQKARISIFPHFRNPDDFSMRKWHFGDGFFNGGVLAVTEDGLPFLGGLYERCLREMAIDYERNLFVDQKYYNNFLFEGDGIYINLDHGLNYSTWNSERVFGLVGPSQRSFLLGSGSFARLWHISSEMRKDVYKDKFRLENQVNPVLAIYFLTKIHLLLLMLLHADAQKKDQATDALSLRPRFESHCDFVKKLAPGILLHKEKDFFEKLASGNERDLDAALAIWLNMVLDSICFDNFALYAIVLEQLFGKDRVEKFAKLLRRHDLRYVAEEILPDMSLDAQEREFSLEAKGAGEILKERIAALEKAGIRFA